MIHEHPRYFFHINHSTNPFNQLEDDVREKIKCWNSALLINRTLLLKELSNIVKHSNETFKRCTSLSTQSGKGAFNEIYFYVVRQNGTHLLTARFIEIVSDLTDLPPEKPIQDA